MIEPLDTQYTADQQFRRELKQIKPLSEQEETAIYERIRSGDTFARRELVTPNLPFAAAYVKRFVGCGIEYADLRQLAAMGLLEAADKYDPDAGVNFRTFAVYHIKSVVVREIERHGHAVRIPSHMLQEALRYRQFVSAFEKEHGREPTDSEAEACIGIPRSKLTGLIQYLCPVLSLDQPISGTEDELTIGNTIDSGEDLAEIIADEDERVGLCRDINHLLDDLPSDEASALRGRYFRLQTYAQMAEHMGTTERAVKNSFERGLRHLRTYRARQVLSRYVDYCVDKYAYKSGLKTWQETCSSSTERAVLKILEYHEKPE